MNVSLKPGKYVLAVSGGVDSMVLLDILKNKPGVELVVAHFEHGIRQDANKDTELVKKAAEKYGLKFETKQGKLGSEVSEDTARKARYDFLESVRQKHKAKAIITAHHQDDMIETALLNILRGSKFRGLSAIVSNKSVLRPLLKFYKEEILSYAKKHSLKWREDITNKDTKFLRNYLRHKILPNLTTMQKDVLTKNIDNVAKLTNLINQEIATISHFLLDKKGIDRQKFALLSTDVANELMASWMRQRGILQTDTKIINRLVVFLKTGQPSTSTPVKGKLKLKVDKSHGQFEP